MKPDLELPKFKNKARCRLCKDVIESKFRWDFVSCKCGAIAVDGGNDYHRRVGNRENFEVINEPFGTGRRN